MPTNLPGYSICFETNERNYIQRHHVKHSGSLSARCDKGWQIVSVGHTAFEYQLSAACGLKKSHFSQKSSLLVTDLQE